MCEAITKEVLVYVESHDNIPQRMRLWIRADKDLDGLLWQIERQLVEGSEESTVPRPFESTNCSVFVMVDHDGCLAAYESTPYEALKTVSRIVILPKRPIEATSAALSVTPSETPLLLEEKTTTTTTASPNVSQETTALMLQLVGDVYGQGRTVTEEEWNTLLEALLQRHNKERSELDDAVVDMFRKTTMAETTPCS